MWSTNVSFSCVSTLFNTAPYSLTEVLSSIVFGVSLLVLLSTLYAIKTSFTFYKPAARRCIYLLTLCGVVSHTLGVYDAYIAPLNASPLPSLISPSTRSLLRDLSILCSSWVAGFLLILRAYTLHSCAPAVLLPLGSLYIGTILIELGLLYRGWIHAQPIFPALPLVLNLAVTIAILTSNRHHPSTSRLRALTSLLADSGALLTVAYTLQLTCIHILPHHASMIAFIPHVQSIVSCELIARLFLQEGHDARSSGDDNEKGISGCIA